MTEMLSIKEFLNTEGVIFDVRSPEEFTHAQIPGAINLPLFDDTERTAVGTTYKQKGKDAAIQLGLKLAGPKLSHYVSQAKTHRQKLAKIHCWRGGMRSAAMTWLLNFAGIKSVQLIGGYKAFRKWVLEQFSLSYKFIVISGMSGCGKTSILEALQSSGEQVINLEYLAKHRGSTYGLLGMGSQPTNEQFENDLALQLNRLDAERPIWIEDESHSIGSCYIPKSFFNQMISAPSILIETSFEERINRLMADYGLINPEDLILASKRISKRLGSQRTKEIIEAIQQSRLRDAIALALQYYDTTYIHSLKRKAQPISIIHNTNLSFAECLQQLKTTFAVR
jgi:tRNA 2-selenouridine synthase